MSSSQLLFQYQKDLPPVLWSLDSQDQIPKSKLQKNTTFTRIRRTARMGLEGFASQAQKLLLMVFHTDFQDSEFPSQLRRIFSRSPISFSVKTKKVLRFLRQLRQMPFLKRSGPVHW
ncbi:hypothetical protein EYF80_044819 [Liparis tanakae]|uniref:Uncharacterized protein n=1 Tax=Liparis tanakae TaxID=230148 RepID=A0A4Z2FVQ4_9TELE|nr:hypothetical protein EYF80_044819 [Liparis tanakae]